MPRNGERGFTLIEILVVLLIIVVLAAIAFPLFVNQRTKAQDAEAKTTARTALGAIEVFHQDNNTFAGADKNALISIEPALAQSHGLNVTATATDFTITVDSVSGGDGGGPFIVKRTGATTERTCAVPSNGGCPRSGRW
jgi:prepilin-type N-terminal cleavage/methylation domain-containing protein